MGVGHVVPSILVMHCLRSIELESNSEIVGRLVMLELELTIIR